MNIHQGIARGKQPGTRSARRTRPGPDNGRHRDEATVAGNPALIDSAVILGVRVDSVTMEQTIGLLESMVLGEGKHHVVTVNPEFIMTAHRDEMFRAVLNRSALSLPDGIGVVLVGRLLGRRFPERVTGIDVVERFGAIAHRHRLRVFFLGAAPGIAGQTADRLRERYPDLIVAGTYAGSPRHEEEDEICTMIARSKADILLVAYGAPLQDLWIARNLHRLPVRIAMGVGGTFDFIAGVAVRAPAWIQHTGFEWLYRLIREPWRWKRMMALPRFAAAVVPDAMRRNAGQPPPRIVISTESHP